jgi:protein-disulfide isomerase
MVEFADFECPYCLRAFPTVKQVIAAYGDKVRLVYRNYPLPQHPNARPAAEAAQCANDQGKFWPYHDKLFGDPTKLGEADLKKTAAELGLDTERFNTCFDAHIHQSRIEADIKAANAAGMAATPSFFINGRPLIGAPPFEDFKRIIDEELALRSGR